MFGEGSVHMESGWGEAVATGTPLGEPPLIEARCPLFKGHSICRAKRMSRVFESSSLTLRISSPITAFGLTTFLRTKQMISGDPVLKGTRLIAEAWDAGGLYQVRYSDAKVANRDIKV
jgi:hypothetical protein